VTRIIRNMQIEKKRRRRFKQTQSLSDRLLAMANMARQVAEQTAPGVEQNRLLRKAREAEAIVQLDQWLSRSATRT
jgi:hypothetical protein